jgi:hypothetical protein
VFNNLRSCSGKKRLLADSVPAVGLITYLWAGGGGDDGYDDLRVFPERLCVPPLTAAWPRDYVRARWPYCRRYLPHSDLHMIVHA